MDPIFFPNEQNALIKVSVPNPQKPTCFLLEMRAFPENRFTANFLKAYHQALDYVEDIMKSLPEEKKNIGGSLTTASTGKFYCNGLDVPYALRDKEVVPLLISLFSRLTVFRVPTVTAISGHAFGGGFLLALAHDYRVMNSKRGFVCLNEIELATPLKNGLLELVRSKVNNHQTFKKLVLEAYRFNGADAAKFKLVDKIVEPEHLVEEALKLAERLSVKALVRGEAFHHIKLEMYRTFISNNRLGLPWVMELYPKL